MSTARTPARRILVVDVGGTFVKVGGTGHRGMLRFPSGKDMSAAAMAAEVRAATRDTPFDVVSIGYPGPVRDGKPAREPRNLGPGWVGFDFRRAFRAPVRIVNDAALQALGAWRGGRMLFLGLGTGLGVALVVDGTLVATELAHLPYRDGQSYEHVAGRQGRERLGLARWRREVKAIVAMLGEALLVDEVVVGGGDAVRLGAVPAGVRIGTNLHAMAGGLRLWDSAGATPRARRTS